MWLIGLVGPEQHEGAVVEDGVAAAGERGSDFLADHVVREQQGAARGPGAEDVQDVLAVR